MVVHACDPSIQEGEVGLQTSLSYRVRLKQISLCKKQMSVTCILYALLSRLRERLDKGWSDCKEQ